MSKIKTLKSLSLHNAQANARHSKFRGNSPRPNGIECPDCGSELLDSNPMITLTSDPPKKHIKCSNEECGYSGYRVA